MDEWMKKKQFEIITYVQLICYYNIFRAIQVRSNQNSI